MRVLTAEFNEFWLLGPGSAFLFPHVVVWSVTETDEAFPGWEWGWLWTPSLTILALAIVLVAAG